MREAPFRISNAPRARFALAGVGAQQRGPNNSAGMGAKIHTRANSDSPPARITTWHTRAYMVSSLAHHDIPAGQHSHRANDRTTALLAACDKFQSPPAQNRCLYNASTKSLQRYCGRLGVNVIQGVAPLEVFPVGAAFIHMALAIGAKP